MATRVPAADVPSRKPKMPTSLDGCKGDAEKEDQYVCNKFHEIREAVVKFADTLAERPVDNSDRSVQKILNEDHKAIVRYVNWLAMGRSELEWAGLLREKGRREIIVAMLGQALKHEVFDSLYYGADFKQWTELRELEEKMVTADGIVSLHSTSQDA